MATGRIRRTARRSALAVLLACLGVVAGAFVSAPGASAAPTATVEIKDLTPPLVSVDANGVVTFIDRIEDKTVQVGGGAGLLPSLVTVTVHTDVLLHLPSGDHPLQKDQQVAEKFPQSCAVCTITYTYRATVPAGSLTGSALNAAVGQAVATLPQNQVVTYNDQQATVAIGVPTPFIVNTLVPLPNLPGVNLPKLPPVQVPTPSLPGAPKLPGVNAPNGTTFVTTTTTTTTKTGIAGRQYTYLPGAGAPAMAPQPGGTRAFDPSSLVAASGAGGPGTPGLADASASSTVHRSSSSPLSVPALVAVVVLAGVATALARVHQLSRRGAGR
jgi:hypothetical protein